jgi:hypothetical protein
VTFAAADVADAVSFGATSDAPGEYGGTISPRGFRNGRPTTPLSLVLTTLRPQAGLLFDPGSQLTVLFQPNEQSRLVAWEGACANAPVDPTGTSTCTLTVGRNLDVRLKVAPR